MLIEEINQSILEGMYKDWRKSVDGGMDPMIPFVNPMIPFDRINREIVPYGRDPMTQFVQTEREFRGVVINLVGAIMARIQLINRHDDLTVRILKRTAISIRDSMRSGSPNDKAIMRDLIRLADVMRDLIEFIGPVDDAAVRDLIQLTRETEALTRSPLPIDDCCFVNDYGGKAVAPLRVDKKPLHLLQLSRTPLLLSSFYQKIMRHLAGA